MTFLQRMLAIVIFPLSFLLIFVFFTASSAFKERSEAAQTVAATQYFIDFSALIHELQKERGMSVGYVSSQGTAFSEELDAQRLLVDDVTPQADVSIMGLFDLAPDLVGQYIDASNELGDLRERVSALDITGGEVAAAYTAIIRSLFDMTRFSTKDLANAELGQRRSALISLMEAKERAGIERAMGAAGFGSGAFQPNVYMRFSRLGAAQSTLMDLAKEYAAPQDRATLEALADQEALIEIERLRAIVHANRFGGDLAGVTGPQWFEVSTAWINTLRTLEGELRASFEAEANETMRAAGNRLTLLIVFTLLALIFCISFPVFFAVKTRREFSSILSVMQKIADDEIDLSIPFKEGTNEVSQIARMADTFQKNTVIRKSAEYDAEVARQKAAEAEDEQRLNAENERLAEEKRQKDKMERERVLAEEALQRSRIEQERMEKDRERAEQMASAVSELAIGLNKLAKGDLSTQIKTTFQGDLEQLRMDFNGAVMKLSQALEDERMAEEKSRAERLETERKLAAEKLEQSKLEQARLIEQQEKAKRMTYAVEALASALQALANGDLTVSIETPFDEDLEALRVDFNGAVSKLNSLIRVISEISTSIDLQAENLSSDAQSLSQSAESQAASVEEITNSIRNISQSIREISDRTESAEGASTKVRKSADFAGEVSQRTLETMGRIDVSSKEINAIADLVGEIAFQTNLLALNASVEAARAGEHGSGFAVIAGEVRDLAQKSEEAAKDISTQLANSYEVIQKGVSLTHESGESLKDIAKGFGEVSSLITSMRSETQKQNEVTQEIEQFITDIGRRTTGNASMAEESNDSAQQLKQQTTRLANMISQFRHSDDAPVGPQDDADEYLAVATA